jgi:hypothetical protein
MVTLAFADHTGRATGGGLQVKDMTGLTAKYQVAITFSLEDLTGAARAKVLLIRHFSQQERAGARIRDPGCHFCFVGGYSPKDPATALL